MTNIFPPKHKYQKVKIVTEVIITTKKCVEERVYQIENFVGWRARQWGGGTVRAGHFKSVFIPGVWKDLVSDHFKCSFCCFWFCNLPLLFQVKIFICMFFLPKTWTSDHTWDHLVFCVVSASGGSVGPCGCLATRFQDSHNLSDTIYPIWWIPYTFSWDTNIKKYIYLKTTGTFLKWLSVWTWESGNLGVKPQVWHLPAVWLWRSDLPSVCLSFFISETK